MIACVTLTVDNLSELHDVAPEGYKILRALAALLAPLIVYLLWKKILWSKLFRVNTTGEQRFGNSELSISLNGEPESRPIVLYLKMTNHSGRIMDIKAPVIVFKRWRSSRKFRIRKVNESEIYPLLLDHNQSHELTIQLEPFYRQEPILRTATRVRMEVEEVRGSERLRSRFVRLKWI
ncbi:hypothetical protein [Prolixibacter sp. SD074]|jgi:hypothetical protein|uniref:hypothetical protein n=1 Tax=Prolixibacter sp. SD074 TaxID=2652391 RepID=UPI001298F1F3|nr:hypothetical protein [Prolixibacter sp. SD074]